MPKSLIKALALVVVVAFAVALMVHSGLADKIDRNWMETTILSNGASGVAMFIGLGTLLTASGMPRQILAFVAGFGFGALPGVLISAFATVLGCMITFSLARLLGRQAIIDYFPRQVAAVDRVLSFRPIMMTICIRIMPLGNNFATNLAAGVTSVNPRHYFLGSFIGYFPLNFIFASLGAGLISKGNSFLGVSIAMFVCAIFLGGRIYRQYKQNKHHPLSF